MSMTFLLVCQLLLTWCWRCNSRSQEPSAVFTGEAWVPIPTNRALGDAHGQLPIAPSSTLWESPSTLIFVGLVDYRDPRCATTIDYLFSRAKYPDRVRIGIAQQRHTEDDHFHCINDYCNHQKDRRQCLRRSQLKMIEFTHLLARGPNYARYLVESLLTNEDFYLSLDAHMDVVDEWDVKLLQEWRQTGNEFAIVSTQPPDVSVLVDRDYHSAGIVPHLCQWEVDDRGFIVSSAPTQARNLAAPLLTTVFNPGFAFMRAHAVRKVVSDPLQQLIYDSDAFLHYARLWTHGYDVYTPTQPILGHDYLHRLPSYAVQATTGVTNDVERMQWAHPRGDPDNPWFLYTRARERFHLLLGGGSMSDDTTTTTTGAKTTNTVTAAALETLTQYQLGRARTIQAFATFVGMDWWSAAAPPSSYPPRSVGDRCALAATWVPYEVETSLMAQDPWVDPGDLWGQDAELLPASKQNVPFRRGSAPRSELLFHPVRTYTRLAPSSPLGKEEEEEVAAAAAAVAVASEPEPEATTGASAKKTFADSVVGVVEYETGELWWIFQWLDRFIDVLIDDIDAQVRRVYQTKDQDPPPPPSLGHQHHGRHVIRVVLVVFPVMLLIVLVAVSLLLPPGARPGFVQQWLVVGGDRDGSGGLSSPTAASHRAAAMAAKRYVLPTTGDKHM